MRIEKFMERMWVTYLEVLGFRVLFMRIKEFVERMRVTYLGFRVLYMETNIWSNGQRANPHPH